MRGPMDDAIESGAKKNDKARERLDQFLKDRFPEGIPSESRPYQEKTEPVPKKNRKKAKKTRRNR